MQKPPKIRLFINQELNLGQEFTIIDSQAHYILNVMRLNIGDRLRCFDGKSGEYECSIISTTKKHCIIKAQEKAREYESSPNIWILFAPVKKDQTDFIIQKSTELGVSKIIPTITQRTISEKIKKERFIAQATEASEQCRRLDLPEIEDSISLEKLLSTWDSNRKLYFMDETGNGNTIYNIFSCVKEPKQPSAILVGPEGGFDEKELEKLRNLPYSQGISLGKRILRAETAVAASLSCWQALCGDWK